MSSAWCLWAHYWRMFRLGRLVRWLICSELIEDLHFYEESSGNRKVTFRKTFKSTWTFNFYCSDSRHKITSVDSKQPDLLVFWLFSFLILLFFLKWCLYKKLSLNLLNQLPSGTSMGIEDFSLGKRRFFYSFGKTKKH